ncbi:protein FAM32A-like [Senna tora]|uniref:Protein FAM32A-like n=1 Tax=Senna tora TaxID=362788 RepID=A0A834T7H5_9FABA|nr:protein FAM32A-like [Senna tora]
MSSYDNVVVGKLKLKGKALDIKDGGIKKKKKKHSKSHYQLSVIDQASFLEGVMNEANKDGSNDQGATYDDALTPAEKRFLQQTEKLELQRLAKTARKSHRDRIQEFNQYLANLSEHYDIPKVGPG